MTFNLTYPRLDPRQPLKGVHYNTLASEITTYVNSITGAKLEAPLILSKTGQHLDGEEHYLYGFSRYFGTGSSASAVRDVTGYGATANGSSDDWGAIMDAIDDMPASGGVLLFPPGTYSISDTIDLQGRNPRSSPKSGVTLLGCGRSTIITLAAAADVDMLRFGEGSSYHCVMNCRLTGNSISQTTINGTIAGINCTKSTQCLIQNVWIDDIAGYGIRTDGCTSLIVANSWITATQRSGIKHGSDGGPSSRHIYYGCHFNTIGSGAPLDGDAIGLTAFGNFCVIANCTVETTYGNGILVGASDSISAYGIVVSNNVISDCGQGLTTTGHGILVYSDDSDLSIKGVSITGNQITTTDLNGISIGAVGTLHGFSVSGNVVAGCDRCGVDASGQYGVISGNVFRNNGLDTTASGQYRSGVLLSGTTENPTTYISVSNNSIFDDQGSPTQQYGVYLAASADDNVILGNALNGNVVAPIFDSGDRNDLGHNAGY